MNKVIARAFTLMQKLLPINPPILSRDFEEGKALNRKISITLAACLVFIITTGGLAAYYASVIADKDRQIADLKSETDKNPKIVIDGLTVEDDRTHVPYTLHIYGFVNNTGQSIAYNAVLHIIATNTEGYVRGYAIDAFHDFTGITGGMSLGLDFRLEYAGSPIEWWAITPVWTDALVTGLQGTFPT